MLKKIANQEFVQELKKILKIGVPAVLESILIAFAGLIDSYMVSTLGTTAVAAVGLTTQPKFIVLAPFAGANVALSALVARRRGENKKKSCNQIFITFLVFAVSASILLSVAIIFFANPIIRACGSRPSTHDNAVLYFRIITGGTIFNCIQLGINAAWRGAGYTKITFHTNLVANFVNIVLNYLLINGHFGFPAWGIKGAALATVTGTIVACVMSILSVLKKDAFISIPYICENKIKPSWSAFKSLIHLGYGIFLEQILMRIGLMISSLMAADQGVNAMAAHQVGMNILGLSFSFGDGLQATAVALIGYNLGAGQLEKVKSYARKCKGLGHLISVFLAITYYLLGEGVYSLFFPGESDIINIGIKIMNIAALVVVLQISQVINMGCLRGAGDTLYTAVVSIVSVTIIRTMCSWFFCYCMNYGIIGVWLGVVGDQLSRATLSFIRYKNGKWLYNKF